ncbi:DNA polymerase zeta catalytic subunit isoform X1 [Hylaeus anthracinus]|uniref:DNA polymerase zeta catalytic subunit isoform X1 n=1 Tax=Hylaeus anthracinus TaxID=313031 RepID=UPI0023B9BC22|nr:DNA polymerase zeta catalytic subunit isoform X1 [Hylaeus anthracinus]
MFSINLVTLDSYQSVPTPELDVVFSHFRGAEIRQVPVIRIFGSTPRGIKTCLHVHGVFPYMYVPCTIENNVDSFMYKLATAIDSAINVSMGSAVSNNQHVYKIQKVSGIPLYGFHKTEHLFFKIYFYNPAMIKRAADLLQNGMILSHSLQPHEAHIPFILQFMMDYNLYGMSLINLKDVKHRQCMYTDSKENSQNENSLSFSNSEKYLPGSVIRQSTCKLEVDAQATDILNRQEIQNVLDINPGIAAIWNNEKCRREANGLPDVESQLLYSNTNDRVYAATDNDIYQEERLAQRLQAISQISETVTSATSSTVSYPLEVGNEDNLINASCVLDHFKLSVLDEESKDEIDLNNQLLGFEKPNISKQTSLLDWSLETSILDTGDIHLVEILANLAGPNEKDKIVDDDSMLGSQYSILSNQIKQDNEDDEDDEVENLNITSFDLDSLSSWNSDTKPSTESYVPEIGNKEEEINKDTAGILENNIEDISLSSFPQYDGLNDLFLKDENHFSKKPAVNKVKKWKKTCKKLETKSKDTNKIQRYSDLLPKKTLTFQLNFNEVSNMNNKLWRILSKLDHQDLDVYDVDEVVHALSLIDYANLNKSTNQINLDKSHFKINDRTIELSIPALDGNASDSSSESELDQDITIDRQEKRICVYKSSTKSKKEANVHSSLKKRRIELENSDFGSPRKRRNICSNLLENELHYTPTKIRSIQNHSLLGKYSPLSIKILSPKAERNLEKNSSIDEPSSSKSTCTTPKRNSNKLRMDLLHNKVCGLSSISVSSKHNQCVSISNQSESLDSEKEECNNTKNNKEVRKRLSFWDTNEKIIDCTTINIDECHSEHSSENEERKIEIPFESENDICNITYTQYLNEKLKSQLDNPNSVSVEIRSGITKDKIISITTKYNPPSRERVINTMKTYDISECKSSGPFFSNKVDLVKQKESSNKNTSINDSISFKSNLFGITGIKLWRRMKINEFYPSGASIKSRDIKRVLAGYNSIIILPLFHPPTPKHVRTWLRAKKYLLERNNKENEIRNNSDVKDTKETETNSSNSNCDKKLIEYVDIEKHNSINEKFTNNKDTKAESQNCNSSKYSDGSNDTLNPSLEKMLENPLLFKNNDTQQHLGISYGQIEYTIKGHSGNVGDENFQNAKGLTVHQYLTLLSVEIHVVTRGKLLPDPEHDSIGAIFYAIHNDTPLSTHTEQIKHGAVVVNCSIPNSKVKSIYSTSTTCPTSYVVSEEDLLNSLITLIRYCDPDILVGWEIESLSWGYILQRASCIGFNNFIWQISRIANVAPTYKGKPSDKDNLTDTKIPGRIILDVWRIMRHEIPLLDYTFENIMYNVLRERISCPPFQTLTEWWKHKNISIWWRVITHYITRVIGTLRILIHRDIIGRTCEHARLFGIQFYEVFSRGSQFRVESMMLRLAKPLNYIPVSPSIQQRANMRAPGSLPLIMEPESVFYTDPLIVLDFQSLYPSIIIAYNYCFSTCLGRVEHIGHHEPFEFGATTLRVKKSTAQKLQGKINFSPCGVAFVKPEIRLGILPRMLTEILNTRLMVKESMKIHGNENSVLQRILYSQQLGLKLIANVTYGYTAANFSGRMPCIEIGDSVVSKGRETLERAIKIVESTPKWGAQVVYGDTDSLFILLPGKSRKDAFIIGAEIADTVTAANPPPVKLKFEKILQPAILQTKKRYCGYMYEFPEQTEPKYLAKGIETVRRDGCPAVAKILEKSLKILFDTKDLSLLKLYVTRQFDKILCRKISIEDLTFAKEFRGLRGYKTNACVPALELTRRLIRKDPRAIPRTGERVRYVIVAGAPNQPLIHCVRTPMEVIVDEGLNPNSVYYITKVIIPPLNRCLNLIGVDVNTWYKEMSHRQISDKAVNLFTDNQKLTIRQFFSSVTCASCGDKTQKDICANCMVHSSQTVTILHEKIRWLERAHSELTAICQSCTGYLENIKCESLNCPVLYRLSQARRDLIQIPYLNNIICDGGIERRNTT